MGYFIFYQEDDERDEDYWAAIYFDEANKQKANEYVYTRNRVKSGKFGHQVNSDIHLQTV